ncbi:ATP-binding protein [Planctomycetota bacterium]
MTEPIFPILGTEDVPMVGRKSLEDRIWNDLTKTTPSNLSIVGPRYIGKTVLLKALIERAKQSESPYSLVCYWQLGYAPPQSDDQFIKQLCDLLYREMGTDAVMYKDYRDELEREKSFAVLKEVMDLLEMDGHSVLMVWDGLDKPLSQGLLSGFLFGQLRELFHVKQHHIVTATRATQSELARNKQVEDSPFWNMFDVNPVRVGPFDMEDCTAAIDLTSLNVNPSGLKELGNWTGGHPVLLLSVLNTLVGAGSGELNNSHVNDMAASVAANLSDFLDKLWNSCSTSVKNAFQLMIKHGELDKNLIGKDVARYLIARGFAVRDGGKLKPACRMFSQHVLDSKPDVSTLSRMFGEWENYRNEIRTVLEMRINQITPKNERLHRLVTRCLDDIPDYPDDCLNNLTSIEEIALDAVWQHEFGTASAVPDDVVSYWTQCPRDRDNIITAMMNADDWSLPCDRYKQLALLQRLTGSKLNFDPKSKSVSKDTYVLLNAIHQFRNRSEHAEGQSIHEGVAVSALLICIELLSCLERELV